MNVTVAVIPRERFRPLPISLRSLFSTIDPNVCVIVVDGGAPENIKKELQALQRDRPFDLVASEKFLLPNMARNVALKMAETKYVVFCDNDLTYFPNWLDSLYKNAEENDSVAVAPITLIGPSNPPIIHHAGGDLKLERDTDSHLKLKRHHRLGRVTLTEAESSNYQQITLEHDYFEYHCVLVRVDAMRNVGGHDERMVMHEHLDSSLRLKAAGGKITFEPKARVMYTAFVKFEDADWPYFLYRWDKEKALLSNKVFAENWGVEETSEYFNLHQSRAMLTVLPKLPKFLNRYRIKRGLLRLYEPKIRSFGPSASVETNAYAAPKPPADALKLAGIAGS